MGGLKLGKEAQAKYDEARIQPDIEGYLEKKGAKRKNWNTRWFVLKDNYLFYAKDNKTNPQGIINTHGCTVCKLEGVTVRPYSFSLLAPKSVSIDAKWTNRTYYLAAKDAKEMERWMKILDESGKKAMENAKKKAEAVQAATENNNKEKEEKEKSEKKEKESKERRKKKKHSKKKKTVKKDSDSEDSDAKNDRDASDDAENPSENDKSDSDEPKREDSYSYSEDEKDSEEEKKEKKKKKKKSSKKSSSRDVKEGSESGTPSSERKKKKSSRKKKEKASSEEESESDEDSS